MAKYFTAKKATAILERLRARFAAVEIEKMNGETRLLIGMIGWSNNQSCYLINEQEDSSQPPLFKRINLFKILQFKIGDRIIKAGTQMKYVDAALLPHQEIHIEPTLEKEPPTDLELEDMAKKELERLSI
jgi:hypothetical protein